METEKQANALNTLKSKLKDLKNLNLDPFQVGNYVDVIDDTKTWCLGEIVERKGDTVKVHFDGWSSKYDEV